MAQNRKPPNKLMLIWSINIGWNKNRFTVLSIMWYMDIIDVFQRYVLILIFKEETTNMLKN